MARPRMIVVAGPPGSGKTRYFPVSAFGYDWFNIDDRVRVYDSTKRWAPPRLVAYARDGNLVRCGATPEWLEAALAKRSG